MAKKAKRAARGSLKKSLANFDKRIARRKARKAKKTMKLDRNTPSAPDPIARALGARMVTPKGLKPRPYNTRWLEEIEVGKRHRTEFGDIEGLALSYGERGAIIQPIAITENDELIAGERRMKAWAHPLNKFRNDPIPVHVITIDSIVAGEWDENAHRKDFTPTEAVSIKREIEKLLKVHAKERQRAHGGTAPGRNKSGGEDKGFRASERAAALTGKKRRTLEKAEAVVDAAEKDPQRFGKLREDMDRTGKVDGPHKRLKTMLAKDAIQQSPPGLPMNGPYATLSIDFPWPAEVDKDQAAIDAAGRSFRPYPEMSIKSCCEFARKQIRPIMAESCAVWLHVPNHHLVTGHAHHVIAALGFNVALIGGKADADAKGKPVTMLTWAKDKIGRGQVLRDQTEHVILLIRGKPVIDVYGENPPTTLLNAPRRDNSQKPDEFYRLVERVTPAKRYAAIFSTGGEGPLWDSHGDQVGKHAAAAQPAPTIFEQLQAKQEMVAAAASATETEDALRTQLLGLETVQKGGALALKDLRQLLFDRKWISHAKHRKAKLTDAGEIRLGALRIKFRDGVPLERQMEELGGFGNIADAAGSDGAPREPGLAAAADHRDGDRQPAGPELPFGEPSPACRVCGCTSDRTCPGGCARVERTLCSKCLASQDHVVSHTGPGGEDGQAVATCSCGGFVDRRPWGDHHVEQDKAIRAHWQAVVGEATGIPPNLRRHQKRPLLTVQP